MLSGEARPPIIVHTFHGHVLRGYFNPLFTRIFRELERALAAQSTRLVAVGPQVRDDLVALGVAPAEQFTVIRLGIDLDNRITDQEEHRAELRRLFGVPLETFVVGWIGRMTAIKRVPDVLLAFRRLLALGIDARLCLVGDGPDRERVERTAHELGVSRSTLFIGYQRDVAQFYSLFDALLLPSANEGTPVVAIEALASRRPVVATRVGGVPDVISEGVHGYLVGVGDVTAMSDRLAELAADPEKRRAMGDAGRESVVRRYRVERLIDDVDALYRELLRDAGLPQPPAGTPQTPASSSRRS
jgi:glycosyltransferase involved in cell wall biosynthesis